ncbi:MAG: discoidin domain-containing protein [Candidatus Pacearchaeota archaeon]
MEGNNLGVYADNSKKKRIIFIIIIGVLLIIAAVLFFYFTFLASPEKKLDLTAEIEQVVFNPEDNSVYIKLAGGTNDKEISKVKFTFVDINDNNYFYETTEGLQEINVPFKRYFWEWLLKRPKLSGIYNYKINLEKISGLTNFDNVNEISVIFEYKTATGTSIDSPKLDTQKPTPKVSAGGGGGGGGGGDNPPTTCTPKTCADYAGYCESNLDDECGGTLSCSSNCGEGFYCYKGEGVTDICVDNSIICQDSDELNYFVKGNTSLNLINYFFDSCSLNNLTEFYCSYNGSEFSIKNQTYTCLEGCLDGACFTPVCIDSDGDKYNQSAAGCGVADCDDNVNSCNINCTSVKYLDFDNDNYVNLSVSHRACDAAANYKNNTVGADCNDNNNLVSPAMTEDCNGIDDNCNGNVDENFGQTSCGLGICYHTIDNCVAGVTQTCNPMQGAVTEVCEGLLDEDCNGVVDNGCDCTIGETKSCGSDIGECKSGLLTCQSDGKWGSECVGLIESSPEVCDGKDNDCDGMTDENSLENILTQDCYEGPLGTEGIGICIGGTQTCILGSYGDCIGDILPSTEKCDSILIDEDCDKSNNEDCDCNEGDIISCGSDIGECISGTQTCNINGEFGDCVNFVGPSSEICDGKDNDCNNLIDDADFGQSTCGVGICYHTIDNCVAGVTQTCNPMQGAVTEVCEGLLDEDCNGVVDNGCDCTIGETKSCGSDIGECKSGLLTCQSDGKWGSECVGLIESSPEVCDGKDNDCDGMTDNNPIDCSQDYCIEGSCVNCIIDSDCDPFNNIFCNPLDNSCSGILSCDDCGGWLGWGCDYESCHDIGNCYFDNNGWPLPNDCTSLSTACLSILDCSDYSDEECTADLCNIGCYWDGNSCEVPISGTSLSVSAVSVGVGDTFSLDINTNEISDLYGFDLDIDYDSTKLQYAGISQGNFLTSDGAQIYTINPDVSETGKIKDFVVSRLEVDNGVSGEGTIAQIQFIAINSGIADFSFSTTELMNSAPSVIGYVVGNSEITIQEIGGLSIQTTSAINETPTIPIASICINNSDCNDNINCTIDSCISGNCTHILDNNSCSIGNYCTLSGCATIPVVEPVALVEPTTPILGESLPGINLLNNNQGTFESISVSSFAASYNADKLRDNYLGGYANIWRSYPSNITNQDIIIKLKNSYEFDTIELFTGYSGSEAAKNVDIYVSDDGTTWTLIKSKSLFGSVPTPLKSEVIEFSSQNKQYLKIHILDNWGSSNYISIGEIRVYKNTENVAALASTTVTATSGASTIGRIKDSSFASAWSPGILQNINITWTFASSKTVNSLEWYGYYGGNYFPKDYAVYASDDGDTWNEISSGTLVTSGGEYRLERIEFPETTTKYLKFNIKNAYSTSYIFAYEIRIMDISGQLSSLNIWKGISNLFNDFLGLFSKPNISGYAVYEGSLINRTE